MGCSIKVSVIVPIYNVEEYLRECLDSLVVQTLKELEVIMVDDGSTDSSAKIAEEYAEKYENFTLIKKENGGLGQARNYGIPYANGEYIAFVDSDDIISKSAYEKMYKKAKENDNDIVIGNVKRFNSKKEYDSVLHTRVFKTNINSTHITKNPELIYDTTAWNKLFKYKFWLENKLMFPEGILYEDIPVTIPAHFLSTSTSVLCDVIYYWRERDGITKSITQERTDITNFTDRLYGLKIVDKFIEENVNSEICKKAKYYKWLDLDLKLYINKLDQVDDEYRERFIELVSEYIKNIPEEMFKDLRAIDKMKYYCIQEKNINLLLEVLKYEKSDFKYLEIEREKDTYKGKFPFKDIPEEYYIMNNEFNTGKIVRNLKKISFKKDKIVLNGNMYIPRVSVDSKNKIKLSAELINIINNKSMPIEIISESSRELTQKFGVRINDLRINNRLHNYDWCGYRISIDLNERKILDLGEGTYKIKISMEMPGIKRSAFIGGPVKGEGPRPVPYLINYNKYIVNYNSVWDLEFKVTEEKAGITKYYENNEEMIFKGWFSEEYDSKKILIINWDENKRFNITTNKSNDDIDDCILEKYPKCTSFTLKIKKETVINNWGIGEWFLNYYKNGKQQVLLGNSIDRKNVKSKKSKIDLRISKSGAIIIRNRKIKAILEDIKLVNDKYYIKVHHKEECDINNIKLKFISNKYGIYKYGIVTEIVDKNTFIFEVDTKNKKYENIFVEDLWDIYLEENINGKIKDSTIDVISNNKYKTDVLSKHKYKFITNKNGCLQLKVSLKWSFIDKGPKRREALERYVYPLFKKLPMRKKTIIFESYWGAKYNCNPKYLYEYINDNHPEYECVWFLKDESIEVYGNAKKVRIGSLKYFYYMAVSKYFVNNVNFPDFHKKRNNTIEIQTMHGTPLKTLGLDIPGEFKTNEGREKFINRCKRWDYLIVSSDKVADITKSCFKFENEYLKVGYPRIDKIFKLNTNEVKEEVKSKLNIPKEKKVILYAPTWRVKDRFDMRLNLEEMKAHLGEEYILLMRLHPFSVKGFDRSILNDFVIDVTGYEDIERLYLISDILITDYSSVMFDYSVLDKPMIFFTYDLDLYKNNLRGFNLEFEKEAPGPILSSSEDVVTAIEKIDLVKEEYRDKYIEFKNNYSQYEKGDSSKQIFNIVFE